MNTTQRSQRIWELDALRGVAMIMMATFHLVFDLAFFYGMPIAYERGFWYVEGLSSALLFMLVSGTSATLGRNPVRRGVTVFGWGMVLTVATYLADPSLYIRFGILHFLGAAMIVAALVRRWPPSALMTVAAISILLGLKLRTMQTSSEFLFPLGLISANFQSLDYYPLFPYLGVYLLGIAAGRILYSERRSLIPARPTITNGLEWLGQQSLAFYLVHQPVLLGLLYLFHRSDLL